MTEIQYLALSAISYSDLNGITNDGKQNTIQAIIPSGKINEYKDTKGNINPEFQALSTILSWKLIAFQPNTASGFSGAAFQAPDGPNGEPGEIVFAFRGTEKDEIQKRNGVLPEDILQKLLENVKHGISSTYSMFSSYCYSYTLSVQ